MSPREKGRYLRERGWTSSSLYGVVSWSDPQNRCGGGLTTKEAYAKETARTPVDPSSKRL